MGGGIQTCRIAKMKGSKRSHSWRKSTDSIKRDMLSSPFNSSGSPIRQRSQHQEEAGCPPIFDERELDQYGSNSKNIIRCCTFAGDKHEQGCNHKSQADHAVIIGLSTQALARNHSNLHLELQAELQVTDHSPQPERNVTHHRHRSSHHGASSGGTRKLEDLARVVHEKGLEIINHRRIRSFTDDNFDILQSCLNAASCAKTLEEIVDEDLRNKFCALGIEEARPSAG